MNEEAILDEVMKAAKHRCHWQRYCEQSPNPNDAWVGENWSERIRQALGELAEAWNREERVVEGAREGGRG